MGTHLFDELLRIKRIVQLNQCRCENASNVLLEEVQNAPRKQHTTPWTASIQ